MLYKLSDVVATMPTWHSTICTLGTPRLVAQGD